MKTIHRKTQTDSFTVIPNALLHDASLSFRARGLLVMMLSMPDDWRTYQTWLEQQGHEGREAIRAAVRELETAGYLRRERVMQNGRIIGLIWHWSDAPSDGKPPAGKSARTKYPSAPKSKASEAPPLRSEEVEAAAEKEPAAEALKAGETAEAIAPIWKPSALTMLSKEEQLRRLPNAEEFPSEDEFDEFLIGNGLCEIYDKRPDLYLVLCKRKWRHWSDRISKWRPIRHWQSYVQALNETIRRAGTLTLNILQEPAR